MFRGCLIQIYLQDVPHFDFLILSNTFLCNFVLVFWQATLAFMGPLMFTTIYRGVPLGKGGRWVQSTPPPLSKKVPFFKKKPKWYYFVYFLFKNIACFYLPWFYLLGLISREIVSYTQIRCKFELWDNGLLIRNCAYTRDCSHITSSIILWFMTTPFPCNQP